MADDEKTAMLKKAFGMFDQKNTGFIECDNVAALLNTMGQQFDEAELQSLIEEVDKQSDGFITTAVLRDILAALDDKLTAEDLDGIIEEVDEDGSGTVDFEEFMEMMAG